MSFRQYIPFHFFYVLAFWTIIPITATAKRTGADTPAETSYFGFTPKLRQAYDLALSLRLKESALLIKKIKLDDPSNALVYLIEDYLDFFALFIGENEADFERLVLNKKKRIAKIKAGDKNSPFYLYAQAEINLHWALIRTKFEQRFRAFNEINYAYELLTKNQYRFPDFYANKKSLGVLHAALGTIPNKYKWGVKLLSGMEGTIEQGLAELEAVIAKSQEDDFFFADESLILYAFIQLHLNNSPKQAYQIVRKAQLDIQNNPLACFVYANIAMRTGHNDEAIETLLQRPQGDAFLDFPYLDFLLGVAKLHRLDADADIYLKKFLNRFNGRNYIKEAYQKLAWHSLIFTNSDQYRYFIQKALELGYAIVDEDKNALREAIDGTTPHRELLVVRMLSDGAYYHQALDTIQKIDIGFDEEQYIEYIYRKARLFQQIDLPIKALERYAQLLDTWPDHRSYMICNAALQAGLIYEQLHNPTKALLFFEIALSKDPLQYKVSIHQKAKAGMVRLKGGT